MPTAIPTSTPAKPGDYTVGRPGHVCAVCSAELPMDIVVIAGLRETPDGFERIDAHVDCWPTVDAASLLAFWQTHVRTPETKKAVFVDDDVLTELFARLQDTAEPAKQNFRFVLGLILMRKRILSYESTQSVGDHDVWTMKLRGRDDRFDLVNPHLNEAQVAEVSQQLGTILNEEL